MTPRTDPVRAGLVVLAREYLEALDRFLAQPGDYLDLTFLPAPGKPETVLETYDSIVRLARHMSIPVKNRRCRAVSHAADSHAPSGGDSLRRRDAEEIRVDVVALLQTLNASELFARSS